MRRRICVRTASYSDQVTTRVIGSGLWEESKDAVDEKDEEECMPLNLEFGLCACDRKVINQGIKVSVVRAHAIRRKRLKYSRVSAESRTCRHPTEQLAVVIEAVRLVPSVGAVLVHRAILPMYRHSWAGQ